MLQIAPRRAPGENGVRHRVRSSEMKRVFAGVPCGAKVMRSEVAVAVGGANAKRSPRQRSAQCPGSAVRARGRGGRQSTAARGRRNTWATHASASSTASSHCGAHARRASEPLSLAVRPACSSPDDGDGLPPARDLAPLPRHARPLRARLVGRADGVDLPRARVRDHRPVRAPHAPRTSRFSLLPVPHPALRPTPPATLAIRAPRTRRLPCPCPGSGPTHPPHASSPSTRPLLRRTSRRT